MRKCKLLLIPLCLILLLSCVPSFGITAEEEAFTYGVLDYGEKETPHALSYDSAEAMLQDMTQVASSANLELYIDETNLGVAVKNLKTGVITTSNPYNAAQDELCVGEIANAMQSQAKIQYTTLRTGDSSTMYSFSDCVELGQFLINPVDNGVEVIYSLGEDLDNQIIPDVMTEESYNWLLEQLNTPENLEKIGAYDVEEINDFLSGDWGLYTYLSYADMADDPESQKHYLEQYPNLETTNLYVRTDALSPRDEETLKTYLVTAGYTNEMKQADFKASGIKVDEGEEAVFPNFKFTVKYSIDDEHFYAELDSTKVEYDTETFCLESVSVLPYFGASKSTKDGYIFLPDGCGTIVSFDDPELKHSTTATLQGDLYGEDNGSTYPRDATFNLTLHLPVFGLKDGNNALFAIIQDGDAMSGITAELKSVRSSYFCVYPTFTVQAKDSVRMESKAGTGSTGTDFVDQFSPEPYTGNFKVQYNFLKGDAANYVGMASTYREYLEAQGWDGEEATQSIRFQMNSLGSVRYATKWGFIPYTATAALTTYQDNQTMIDALREMGITDVDLQLLGWQKTGLDTMAVNKYRASSKLGGTDDLKTLIAYCEENSIGFYPEADLMYVAHEAWFDGFSARADAVRLINNQYGTHAILSPTYGTYMNDSYALAPTKYATYLDKFLSSYTGKTGGTSVNLARMGLYLNSDYKKDRITDRQESKTLIEDLLKNTSADTQLAFNGGNAYVLPYASQLLDTPINSTGREGETYDVPFLQMVILNKVTYAAPAVNTATDRQDYLLRCIETQSSPSFNLIYQNADILKSTDYTQYYNVDFAINKNDFASYYEYVKTALDGVAGVAIKEHARLSTNVVRIRYENGVELYINYNKYDVTVDGHTIEAQSYIRP